MKSILTEEKEYEDYTDYNTVSGWVELSKCVLSQN